MNKAVLFYTFALKYSKFSITDFLISLGFLAVFLVAGRSNARAPQMVFELYSNPALIMLFAYIFTSDAVNNSKSLNDGEYLSLLFSRPITRASYILTKWLTTSIAVFVMLAWNIFLYFAFQIALYGQQAYCPSPLEIFSLIANCISFSALMMLVRSMKPKVGIIVFIVLTYAAGFGSLGIGPNNFSSTNAFSTLVFHAWAVLREIFAQVVFPSIDLVGAVKTAKFSLMPFIVYLSNTFLYLFLAIALINRREFSYAQD